MNIELENLLKFIKQENENKSLTINEAYNIFFCYLKEFQRIDTYKYHFSYYRALKPFFDMNNVQYTNQINNDIILKLINYLKIKGNKNTTINKKIGSIKYMLNYLYKKSLISKHTINIEKLKNDEKRFEIIEQETLKKIIEVVNTYNNKDRLIMLIFITTGIRRTELYKIKLADIFLKEKRILLSHTKSGKPRNIFLIDEIIELIKIQMQNSKVYLFENEQHTSNENPSNICNIIKKIKRDLNIKKLSPHMFRHTYATTLLENGVDLESIRLLLGHSDYSMIMRYVHIKEKKLADISTSFNPYKTN